MRPERAPNHGFPTVVLIALSLGFHCAACGAPAGPSDAGVDAGRDASSVDARIDTRPSADAGDAADVRDVALPLDVADARQADGESDAGADSQRDAISDAGPPCPGAQERCSTADAGAVCVDLINDPRHCGGCDTACCPGALCTGGRCVFSCSPGTSVCACACVDLQNDARNCGACGVPCAGPSAVCRSGVCMSAVADAGARDAMVCLPASEPPSPSGVCDGRGRIACQTWADGMITTGAAYAQCVSSPSGCARADQCTDSSDVSTCRCGGQPACDAGQVCAGATSADVPTCRCLR